MDPELVGPLPLIEAAGGSGLLSLVTDSVQLAQRRYEPADGLEHNHNTSDRYLIVMPYTRGRIRLQRGSVVLYDGDVRPGIVRLVAPGERSTMATQARFEAALLSLPAAVVANAAESLRAGRDTRAVHDARQDLRRLCPPLISALQLRGRQRDMVVGGLATAVVALILGNTAKSATPVGLDDDLFASAVEFAEQRLRCGLELQDWAAAVGMEAAEFSRRFRKHTGVAPYAWFMDRRIDESMRLLAATDQPIIDVALEMGFSSQSHFTDMFRRRAGMAPGHWRAARTPDPPPASRRK